MCNMKNVSENAVLLNFKFYPTFLHAVKRLITKKYVHIKLDLSNKCNYKLL